jgi:hypothetical protein
MLKRILSIVCNEVATSAQAFDGYSINLQAHYSNNVLILDKTVCSASNYLVMSKYGLKFVVVILTDVLISIAAVLNIHMMTNL